MSEKFISSPLSFPTISIFTPHQEKDIIQSRLSESVGFFISPPSMASGRVVVTFVTPITTKLISRPTTRTFECTSETFYTLKQKKHIDRRSIEMAPKSSTIHDWNWNIIYNISYFL